MREVFKGWKRKLGVLTLLMACVFMAGWVRSLFMCDFVNLSLSRDSSIRVISDFNRFDIMYRERGVTTGPFHASMRSTNRGDCPWWDVIQFGSGTSEVGIPPRTRTVKHSFAGATYSFTTILFTLLSAFLLLTKPYSSKQTKIIEPIPDDGA